MSKLRFSFVALVGLLLPAGLVASPILGPVASRADGAGASGNPRVSLLDILLKRKPPTRQVQIAVGAGTTIVPIRIKYF